MCERVLATQQSAVESVKGERWHCNDVSMQYVTAPHYRKRGRPVCQCELLTLPQPLQQRASLRRPHCSSLLSLELGPDPVASAGASCQPECSSGWSKASTNCCTCATSQ